MTKRAEVKFIIEKANFALAGNTTQDERKGIARLLETILHATGNYKGFGYLEATPDGQVLGPWANVGDVQAGNYDETRRFYYINHKL